MIQVKTSTFKELSTDELYGILQLRSEVFVVEQDCVYQDIDGKDFNALHVLGLKNGKIVAYARAFRPGDYFQAASIGRVVVSKEERQNQYGVDIMDAAIIAIQERFNETRIDLSAQTYLKRFYNDLGFRESGEEYLEDGIPHILMIKD